MRREMKRLVFDIETSPGIYWAWNPGNDIRLPWENMLSEPAVICISYKWVGEKKTHHLQWDEEHNDKAMLEKFIPIMQEADVVIGHNSDRFDIKWLRTRCLFHGIDMPPDFVSIDTYKDACKYFRFNSNSLKYIAKFCNVRQKKETSKGLWKRVVFESDKKALKEMISYCDGDVESTEDIYLKMVPYVAAKGHVGKYVSDCPHCGSDQTRFVKERVSAKAGLAVQFQCQEYDCGKYHTIPSSKWIACKPIKRIQ